MNFHRKHWNIDMQFSSFVFFFLLNRDSTWYVQRDFFKDSKITIFIIRKLTFFQFVKI